MAGDWQKLNDVLLGALELDPDERASFVADACGGDRELEREVWELLEVDDEALERVERPAVDLVGAGGEKASGERIGPYRLVRQIGQGGMGTVYLAARGDETPVAVKVLKRGHDADHFLRRFEREREILERLDHPYIARLLDAGRSATGRPYLVMERVTGEPIDRYCERLGLGVAERLELFLKVLEAVAFAHRSLVVHRDLKPSNILVTPGGEPRLLDFGIAKLLAPDTLTPSSFTASDLRIMTPEYASPEQVKGHAVSPASDVYALGVVLYELLTGRRPFELRGSFEDDMRRVLRDEVPEAPSRAAVLGGTTTAPARPARGPRDEAEPPPPLELRRLLAGDLDLVVLTALRKDPERRYASVTELADDLRRFLAGRRPLVRRRLAVRRLRSFVGHWRELAAVAAAVAAVVFLVVHGLGEKEPPPSFDKSAARLESELADKPELRAQALLTLGRVERSQGHYAAAVPLFTKALAALRSVHGDRHEKVAAALDELALLRRLEGQEAQAAKLYAESLDVRRGLLGDADPETARAAVRLASTRLALGEAAAAEELASGALAVLEGESPADEVAIARARCALGGALAAQGRHAAAEPLLVSGWDVLSRRGSVPEHEVEEARRLLVALYEDWGRPQEADRYR